MRTRIVRWAPALVLFFLAPLVAEFLLGDLDLLHIGALLLLAPLYGGGAILIREVVRRRGGGWPAMLLLAAAYGVVEEGLLTQSLFNRRYLGLSLLDYGYVPALGISPAWTVFVLTIHVVWSMSVPIALTETIFRARGTAPWLGIPGLVVAAILYLVGAVGTFVFTYRMGGHFMAAPAQVAVSAVVALALVVVALLRARRPALAPPARRAWNPLIVGAIAFAASSALFLARSLPDWIPAVPPALPAVLMLALGAAAILWVSISCSRRRWGIEHRFALAGGALLTYCWTGITQAGLRGPLSLGEQVVLVVVTVALLVLLAVHLAARERRPVATADAHVPG
jgi:hypothetical protein